MQHEDQPPALGPLSAAAKAACSASTAWMPMHSPGTLKVSNMISAAISLFSGGFRGGSVSMKLWSSLSTLRYLDAKLDLSSMGFVELQQSPYICHLEKEDIIYALQKWCCIS